MPSFNKVIGTRGEPPVSLMHFESINTPNGLKQFKALKEHYSKTHVIVCFVQRFGTDVLPCLKGDFYAQIDVEDDFHAIAEFEDSGEYLCFEWFIEPTPVAKQYGDFFAGESSHPTQMQSRRSPSP